MKKLLLASLITISSFADTFLNQNQALNILKHTPIYSQLKQKIDNKILKVKGIEKKDFYIITLYNNQGSGNIFLTKDLKYTILGNILNNTTKRPLEANYPAEPFKGNKEIVKNGVVFSFGNGKKDLYVVTDPECPFCRRFEQLAQKYNIENKYRIHIIFLPLSFHKHSKDMIYYILSAKTNAEKVKRFKETLSGDNSWSQFKPTKEEKEKIDKIISKSIKAANELKAQGTPSFYDKNFNEIKNRESILR
ncbi:MAG: thiol:disulfide interchange protein [Nautilia sp.]|nr:MAG: thiol:disulfide interchange protein [Nautilia sp.]